MGVVWLPGCRLDSVEWKIAKGGGLDSVNHCNSDVAVEAG